MDGSMKARENKNKKSAHRAHCSDNIHQNVLIMPAFKATIFAVNLYNQCLGAYTIIQTDNIQIPHT